MGKTEPSDADPLLSVEDLEKYYYERDSVIDTLLRRETRAVQAVDGVDFDIYEGETLGLVGESGCGKSTTGETLLRLREATGGSVRFDGGEVFSLAGDGLSRFRERAGIVFQDPFSSLDPRMTIGRTIAEPLAVHDLPKPEDGDDRSVDERRRERVEELLDTVGLKSEHAERYPHEFSGGQRQRVGIARALALEPDFLVLDEPVSALDVSIQAQILNLLADLQDEFELTYLFIAHNLSVVRHICDRVAVMYLGEIVETASTDELFENPNHPYTRALLESVPRADTDEADREIHTLAGDVPSPRNPPSGCRFRTRCPQVIPPTDIDIGQDAYRDVMDLRERLERDDLPLSQYRERAMEQVDEHGNEQDALVSVLHEELFACDFTGQNEAVVETALREIVDGDREAAAATLRERFESVCERQRPTLGEQTHSTACHLYD